MSTIPPSSRRGAARRGRVVGVLTTLGVLAGLIPTPAQAALNIPVSKFPTPTYGTEKLPEPSPFSARVFNTSTHGNSLYLGGEFTSLAPTTSLAGAIDGQSGAPQPGFPKVDSGQVLVATPDGKGGWFVGGSFPSLNNSQVNGLAHILADGTLDANFSPPLVGSQNQPSKSFTVTALAVSGPWLYVGGEFTKFGAKGNARAQDRNHIARVSTTTGTVDPGWNPDTGNNTTTNPVRSIAVSPDGGTVYFSGDFSTVQGQARPGVAAFSGAVTPWLPQVGSVSSVATSSDGRVYVGHSGGLSAVDGNGGVQWTAATAGGGVKSVVVSKDGARIWAAGDFNNIGGAGRNKLAAVGSNGVVDSGFNPDPSAGASIAAITLSEDNSRVYFGGTFDKVKNETRNNLAAVDAATGSLTTWNPNATGAVSSLTASGSLVYAGGNFSNLGATPRTLLGALDLTPGSNFGSALPFAPRIENVGRPGTTPEPPVIQAVQVSPDGTRLYIGGKFDRINGVERINFASLILPSGEVDPAFDAGEPQGAVRAIYYDGSTNTVYAGGDFDSIQISSAFKGKRPDHDSSCGQAPGSSLTASNRCIWERSKVAAFDARTGVVDKGFMPPKSTGPGLIGNGGKACTSEACGTGSVQAIQMSPDRRQMIYSGSFSELENNGKRNTVASIYADGPNRGKLTPWQPQSPGNGVPLFDIRIAGNGMLFAAGGGAGGRALRWDPQIGNGNSASNYVAPLWSHVFDGDATSVDVSETNGYWGGHFDFVDGGAYRRKHAAAFDFNGNIAENWDPEFDTSEGVFTVEVIPNRLVVMAGNFSRVNRRPQPGVAVFQPEPGKTP